MSTNLQNQAVPDLFQLLYERYTEDSLGQAGEERTPAPIKELTKGQSMECTSHMLEAVLHFKKFCEDFLVENPPEAISSLSQGFGLRLAGGFEVNLVPADTMHDTMQDAGDIPVTTPRSMRNQQGVVPSRSVDVTTGK